MRPIRVSNRARSDLAGIARYTEEVWGAARAQAYLDHLQHGFELLATYPELGRATDPQGGRRRLEQGSHVIFYRPDGQAILIQRVLHKSMLPRL